MKIHRKKFIFGIVILWIIVSKTVFAIKFNPSGFGTIFADTIDIDSDTITANGSVHVLINPYDITASTGIIYPKAKRIKIMDGTIKVPVTRYTQLSISSRLISGNIQEKSGTALDPLIHHDTLSISGKLISYSTEKIVIQDARFTTCQFTPSHYQIRCNTLELFPNRGLGVANQATVFVGETPIFWFPVYTFPLKSASRRSTVVGWPELGSTEVDGVFIRQNLTLFVSENSEFGINLGYTEKKGVLLGVSLFSKTDPYQIISTSLNYISKDGIEGNVRYNLFSKPVYPVNEPEEFPLGTLANAGVSVTNKIFSPPSPIFSTVIGYREPVSTVRVSRLPELSAQVSHSFSEFNAEISTSVGNITEYEPTMRRSITYRVSGAISRAVPVDRYIIASKLRYSGSWYMATDSLVNPTENQLGLMEVGIYKLLGDLDTSVLYTHCFFLGGKSPFIYDSENLPTGDEFLVNSNLRLGQFSVGATMRYGAVNDKIIDSQFRFQFNEDCWTISFIHNPIHHETLFNIGLR